MRTELVTTLKRKANEMIAGFDSEHDPVLITQHGKPAAHLMAVETFETLNRRLDILEGIAWESVPLKRGGLSPMLKPGNACLDGSNNLDRASAERFRRHR